MNYSNCEIFPWIPAGFFVTIYVTAFMFKSNDILRKQTALKVQYPNLIPSPVSFVPKEKYCNRNIGIFLHVTIACLFFFGQGERKMSVLVGYFIVFMLHVIGVYWWYRNDDLFYPLFMVPPKVIPPFWHAIFTIVVNGMDFICLLLLFICFSHVKQNGN